MGSVCWNSVGSAALVKWDLIRHGGHAKQTMSASLSSESSKGFGSEGLCCQGTTKHRAHVLWSSSIAWTMVQTLGQKNVASTLHLLGGLHLSMPARGHDAK